MQSENDTETAATLRDKAEKCRWLAAHITNREISEKLLALAREFEERANTLERKPR